MLGKGDKERLTNFDAKTKLHLQEYHAARIDDNPALFVSIRKPATRITVIKDSTVKSSHRKYLG